MLKQAVILVGGRGTRLGALARDVPKPLLPIAGDVRFLDYLLENFARHGVEELILLAGHLGQQVKDRYQDALVGGARVDVIVEQQPEGTAGALLHAADRLQGHFFMSNGDSFLDMNYLALAAAMKESDMGVVAIREVDDAARFGSVVVSETGQITAFKEKAAGQGGLGLISGGVYALRRDILDLISKTPCSLETEIFPDLASRGALSAYQVDGFFLDIGLPETLMEGRASIPTQMRRGAAFFDRDGTLIEDDGYTYKVEDLRWRHGAIEAVRLCNDEGLFAIVVTNQAGIARGLYSLDDMERFHRAMQKDLQRHGAHIDAFYACPYHAEGCVPRLTLADHPDRKPNPGMLRRAVLEWPIDERRSFMIGDANTDVAAGQAMGLYSIQVQSGELLTAVEEALARVRTRRVDDPVSTLVTERAARAKAWLFEHAFPIWWRRGFDPATRTFHERMELNGEPAVLNRRIRVQARQTFAYAVAGALGWDGEWREAVSAGADVLMRAGIQQQGGTNYLLDTAGQVSDRRRDLYDLAFVVLALSSAARALGARPDLIAAAEGLVSWAESNWSAPNGGFLEGEIVSSPPRRQNPHMHMLEALLALYEASGNEAHLARANTIAELFRKRFFDAHHGALPEYFDKDWRPLPGVEGRIAEPGHQFEWSWLLDRCRKLGGENNSQIAERLRVHAEAYGVDWSTQVTYDEVFVEGMVRARSSRFWPHTERIKANIVRYENTRDPRAARAAVDAFDMLMTYCNVPVQGLWHDRRRPEGEFVEEAAPASSFYHATLALSELIRVADTLN